MGSALVRYQASRAEEKSDQVNLVLMIFLKVTVGLILTIFWKQSLSFGLTGCIKVWAPPSKTDLQILLQ